MNVTFKQGEKLANGFVISNKNGLTEFYASNGEIVICFRTDAGEGTNYSQVQFYMDSRTGKTYRAQRYLQKYVSLVQDFSNQLFAKYKEENKGMSTEMLQVIRQSLENNYNHVTFWYSRGNTSVWSIGEDMKRLKVTFKNNDVTINTADMHIIPDEFAGRLANELIRINIPCTCDNTDSEFFQNHGSCEYCYYV